MSKTGFCRRVKALCFATLLALLIPIQVVSGFFDSAAEERGKEVCWSMSEVLDFHLDKSGNASDWGDYRIRAEDDWGGDIVWVQFYPKVVGSRFGFSCFTKQSGVGIEIRSLGRTDGKHDLYCLDSAKNELYPTVDTCPGVGQPK